MNILILIESNKLPWSMNEPSKRLKKWFNVKTNMELKQKFNFVNIYRKKCFDETNTQYYLRLRKLLVENNLIFLVGKKAQRKIFANHEVLRLPLWCQEKYVGLPHPFRYSQQSNKPTDKEIKTYIINVLRSKK